MSCFPRMHETMREMKVWYTEMGQSQSHNRVPNRTLREIRLPCQRPGSPPMTEQYFDDGGPAGCQGGIESVVLELSPRWILLVHFVFVEFVLEGREVEKPIPETANHLKYTTLKYSKSPRHVRANFPLLSSMMGNLLLNRHVNFHLISFSKCFALVKILFRPNSP